jgi:hypothetical protein
MFESIKEKMERITAVDGVLSELSGSYTEFELGKILSESTEGQRLHLLIKLLGNTSIHSKEYADQNVEYCMGLGILDTVAYRKSAIGQKYAKLKEGDS